MPRQIEHLVKMAEEIALNMRAGQSETAAAQRVAEHIERFWTPAMRQQLIDFRSGGGAVSPLVAAALQVSEQTDHNRSDTR